MATDRASRLRGSSPGPHPRIRAAEACCDPSYRGESRLPVAGCRFGKFDHHGRPGSNPAPAESLRRRASRDLVAVQLPVAGCRLPVWLLSKLPVAPGCRA